MKNPYQLSAVNTSAGVVEHARLPMSGFGKKHLTVFFQSRLVQPGRLKLCLAAVRPMQETFFDRSFEMPPSESPPAPSNADLTRVFNAAILSTRADRKRDFAAELYQLVESPAFECILAAIRGLAASGKLTDRQAAEQVIET